MIFTHDESWTIAAVIRGLTRLPKLQDLHLILYLVELLFVSLVPCSTPLVRLSGLKKISVLGLDVRRHRDIISGLAGLKPYVPGWSISKSN